MGAPEPVHIRFAAQSKRKPRIDIAEIFGLYRLTDSRIAVPAGLSFRIPERTSLDCPEIIKPEADVLNIIGIVIMIELNNVKLAVHLTVVHRSERHGVRTDGYRYIAVKNIRLHMDKINMTDILNLAPFLLVMRIYPCVCRKRQIVKAVVSLAKKIEIPFLVQLFDRAEFFFQIVNKFLLTMLAETALAVNLVVALPADHIRIVGKFLCHSLGDLCACFTVVRVVGTAMSPAAVLCPCSRLKLPETFGVLEGKPPRRCCGRSAEDYGYACLSELVNNLVEPAELVLSLFRLHLTPCKFGNTGGVYTCLLHLCNVPVDLAFIPVLGIICNAEIRRFKLGIHKAPPRL